MQLHGQLVPMDEYAWLSFEETIDVLERSICSLWIEEVGDGYEREADDSPNDPELVAETFDAGERGLHNGVIADPVRSHGERCTFGAHFECVDSMSLSA